MVVCASRVRLQPRSLSPEPQITDYYIIDIFTSVWKGSDEGHVWEQERSPEHRRDGPHAEGVVDRVDKGKEKDGDAGEEEEGAEREASDAKGQKRRHGGNGDSNEGQPVDDEETLSFL